MDVVKDLSGWRVDSGLPHMKLRVVQTSCFFSSLQDGHFPWIIFACAGTPAFLGGTPRSLSITSSSRPPTASTCYPWHGHSIAQTCPAQVSVSAIKAPEQSNQERARPRIRLVGRQLGPLATGIFPGGLQARTGPVKGVREDISVGVCCVWIWEGTGGFGQNLMCVCVCELVSASHGEFLPNSKHISW